MTKQNTAIVSIEKVNIIKRLNERKDALQNLLYIDKERNPLFIEELYQRFLSDYESILQQISNFWGMLAEEYNMPIGENISYSLDYDSRALSTFTVDKE